MSDDPPAEAVLDCRELAPALAWFEEIGFRIEAIFPADAPATAVMSGHGLRIRLEPSAAGAGLLRLPALDGPREPAFAPNGTRVEWAPLDPPLRLPPFEACFHVARGGASGAAGRAGMLYRDLIPTRLGGRYIASHISIPQGGPVSDWVHYHRIRFQFLVCRRGWARVVYEDQGPPFRFEVGDCILQPPLIRHRVLESSRRFEVVEIACPALHETLADHDLELPNARIDRTRDFSGQRFHHDRGGDGGWTTHPDGVRERDLGLGQASGGAVRAELFSAPAGRRLDFRPFDRELVFGFVMDGEASLIRDERHALGPTDAFTVPPQDGWSIQSSTDDFELLLVRA